MKQGNCISSLPVRSIVTDKGIQQRDQIYNEGIVAEYADALRDGAKFPPVIVFHDGSTHWLADGYHRVEAAEEAGLKEIAAEIRPGTRRDAILFAAGANRDHGLRRTRADVRRAISTLVLDAEWGGWSDRVIAEKVGCSPTTVGTIRAQLSKLDSCETSPTKTVSADSPTLEELEADALAEYNAALKDLFNNQPPPPPAPPKAPAPAKRIGRDGKARAMPAKPTAAPKAKPAPQVAPKPAPAGNKAVVAMQAAHNLAAALARLEPLEKDLVPSDAQTVITNLRIALERLEARFGLGGMEVKGHA